MIQYVSLILQGFYEVIPAGGDELSSGRSVKACLERFQCPVYFVAQTLKFAAQILKIRHSLFKRFLIQNNVPIKDSLYKIHIAPPSSQSSATCSRQRPFLHDSI